MFPVSHEIRLKINYRRAEKECEARLFSHQSFLKASRTRSQTHQSNVDRELVHVTFSKTDDVKKCLLIIWQVGRLNLFACCFSIHFSIPFGHQTVRSRIEMCSGRERMETEKDIEPI